MKMVKRTLRRTPRKQLRAAAPRAAGRYSEDEYLVEEPLAGTYKVRAGDTLAGIAAQFGLTAHDLEQANGLRSGAPLALGRELIIPDKTTARSMPSDVQRLLESKESKNASNQSSSAGTSELEKYYVIQRGDTPASIAKKLKVNSADLLKVNNIEDPKKLQIGQRLQIPSKIE